MATTRVSTLIDTRVWVLALRSPAIEPQAPLADLAGRAAVLVRDAIEHELVLFTPQLVAEIHHVATSRLRPRSLGTVVRDYLHAILARRHTRFRPATRSHVDEALSLSAESGVHVWDYLVVLPWRGRIDRVITMDPHYRHAHFGTLARIENPLGLWRTEGQPLT